jgi:UPF0755 protein
MPSFINKNLIAGSAALVALIIIFNFFLSGLSPASAETNASSTVFAVQQGEGFRKVVGALAREGLIKSPLTVDAFSLLSGAAMRIQPGLYKLNPGMSVPEIMGALTNSEGREVTVTIPEGDNLYQIDAILANALVIQPGALINFKTDGNLEGKLFPDTYRFFINENIQDVVQKFSENYNAKAAPLFANNTSTEEEDLILASIVDKEVPAESDQELVAGILLKRLKAGMPLDVDATICYIKFQNDPTSTSGCYPLTPVDYKADSAYNTYLYKGLPPGPIGNPGISAIQAVLSPKSSPYWFYLSDPKTGNTIFAVTLDEQNANRVRYLKSN